MPLLLLNLTLSNLPDQSNPSAVLKADGVLFPDATNGKATFIPRFDPAADPEGVASHVPHMDHFFDNSLQTGLMRDLAVDFELLGEHLVLLGNQVSNSIPSPVCEVSNWL